MINITDPRPKKVFKVIITLKCTVCSYRNVTLEKLPLAYVSTFCKCGEGGFVYISNIAPTG